jgi:quinol monooxygenase YgiN
MKTNDKENIYRWFAAPIRALIYPTQENRMFLIHISLQVKEEVANALDRLLQFEQVLQRVIHDARKTTGCLKYDWYRASGQFRQFVAYGEFDSQENFEGYLDSEVFQRIGKELAPFLAAPPVFKHYEANLLENS